MRHRLLLTVGLLVLCASLAACGGSSTTATATTASPTRAATSAPAAASAPAPAAATTAPTAAASGSATVATRPAGSAAAPAASAAPAATTAPTAAPATASATRAPAASAAATTAAPAAAGNTVAVELKDFMIAVDKSTVNAGMVTFTIKNMGPSPHNFNVKINGEEKGVPTLDPGMTMTLTLDLKPGTYDYRCNIPGHDLLGMKGTLTVK